MAAQSGEPPLYLVGPGDALTINVWREPELSTSVTVRPDGRISVPLVEDLMAAGKTLRDLADDIEAELAEYLQDPMVTVTVGSGLGDPRQQIRVVGEAAEPNAIPYRSGMTLLDAVIATGGLSREAAGNAAVIHRQTEAGILEIPVRLADLVRQGDASANIPLEPGDVIVVPEGFFNGEWRITYSGSASVTFTDNIDLDPDGERDAGLITRAGPGVQISGNSARVSAGFNAALAGVNQFGGDDEGFALDPNVIGTSTTELLPDRLFFDLSTSVTRQLLDSRRSSSASGASTSNRDVVATMSASPYFVHRLGNFADAEWRYRITPVLVDSGDNSDVLTHEGSVDLQSGRDFSRLGWSWSNRASQEIRSDEDNIHTASTDLGIDYALWRRFSLIGSVGYEYRDGDENDDFNFDGITWSAGFNWQPNPDLSLQATYGRRDDDESLDASLDYRLGAKTSIRASYSESLETSQGRAASTLGDIGLDPDTGEPIDDGTGEPFEGDLGPFTFDDETTRTRTFRTSASHQSGRNAFNVFGLVGMSEGGSDGDEDFYSATISWTRTLSPELSLTTRGSYDRSEFDEDNREDDTYRASLGLSYQLAPNAQASLSYDFQNRDSTEEDEDFYENAVTLSFSISF